MSRWFAPSNLVMIYLLVAVVARGVQHDGESFGEGLHLVPHLGDRQLGSVYEALGVVPPVGEPGAEPRGLDERAHSAGQPERAVGQLQLAVELGRAHV